MADQKLTDAEVQKKEQKLAGQIENINGQVRNLQNVIDEVETHWKGIGAGAYNRVQHDINERMKKLNRLLAYFLEGIEASRKSSTNNEHDIAQALKGIDVVGGGYGVGSGSKLDMYSPPPAN